nr:queuine tRNA-ribosyltransferase accessory subunit 2-like isoform X2 [Coffea arabica]
MKFAVKKGWSNGRARSGVLQLGSCPFPIQTPALLLTTRKGLPPFISPDLLTSSLPSPDSHLLQFSPLHFLEGISPKTISNIGGLHQMLSLHQHIFAAVPRDSIIALPEHDSTNKYGASFQTPGGRLLIKPAEYVELVSSMKPDFWVTLADEVPAWVSNKRNRTSVDRTLRWLDDCLSLNKTGTTIFGSIVGGSSIEERHRCAQEVAQRNVSGYWIGGFGLGESMDERAALLTAVTRRYCRELLQALTYLTLRMYVYHLTLGGFALTFPLERNKGENADYQLSDSGGDGMKINLKATVYRKDTSPIVESCICFTCQNHTKAYLNHLFNVHEMLAQTLLEIHNTHHYLGFFCSIRKAIEEGKFEQFRRNFVESRRDRLFAAASSA